MKITHRTCLAGLVSQWPMALVSSFSLFVLSLCFSAILAQPAHAIIDPCILPNPPPECPPPSGSMADPNAGISSSNGSVDGVDGSVGCDTSCIDAPQNDTPANDAASQAGEPPDGEIVMQQEDALLQEEGDISDLAAGLAPPDIGQPLSNYQYQMCSDDPYSGDPPCTYALDDTSNEDPALGSGDINLPDPSSSVGDPINALTGNKIVVAHDYTGRGPFPLRLRRFYNSKVVVSAASTGEFGANWRSTFDSAIQTVSGQSVPTVRVVRPDGKSLVFTQSGSQWVSVSPGVTATLSAVNVSGALSGWTYTTHADMTETYNSSGQLLAITSRTGLTETLAYNATGQLTKVSDPFGRTLSFSYDAMGRINQVTNPAGGTYLYGYDANNNLVSVTYPDHAIRQYAYENAAFPHSLTGVVDENGSRFATWSYDSQGRAVSQVLGAGAQSLTLTYGGNATVVTDALGASRAHGFIVDPQSVHRTSSTTSTCPTCPTLTGSLTYDSNGFIASKTDPNGNVTNFTHNALGELTSRTSAAGTPLARTYLVDWHPVFHRPTQITFPDRSISYTYDGQGNRLQRSITAGGATRTWSYQYNSLGLITQITGSRTDVPEVTSFAYDAQGNLASITNALGQKTQCTARDPNGRCLTVISRNGVTKQLTYDTRSRVVASTIGMQTTQYQYAPTGLLTQKIFPTGVTVQYRYDAAHRLTDLTDNLDNHIHFALDGAGHRTEVQLFTVDGTLTRSTSYAFDPLGRQVSTTDANQKTTVLAHDNNGNVVNVTDALGHSTAIFFDALNRPIQINDALGNVTNVQLNAFNQPLQVTAPNGAVTRYSYDSFGELVQEVSPDRGTSNLTYTNAGLPLTRTDARGVTANFTFDALNRPTTTSYTKVPAVNGLIALWLNSLGSSILSDNVSFTYDQGAGCALGVGRLCARHDQSGVESFSYDIHGNVLQQIDTQLGFTYTTQYSYDNTNQLTQMSYPDGRVVNYSLDALERVIGIQGTVNHVASVSLASAFKYRADGMLAGMTFGNGIVDTRGYDPVGRLVSQIVGAVDARAYSYNDVGNLTAKQTSAESDQFTYDSLNRLTGEGRIQGTMTHNNGFGYDPNNNRLTEIHDGAVSSLSYTPDTNRLIQLGSAALTLDGAGNTTADNGGARKFYYTAANHLQWVSQNGLPIAGYLYNGLGQRTGKLNAQGISLYHYDIYGRLISETAIGSQPSRDYIWSGSTPIAQIDHWLPTSLMLQVAHCSVGADGKIDWLSYLHTDALGTPRLATDMNQNVVWRDDGEAFGESAPTQIPAVAYPLTVNLRNSGQYFDQETGLFYNLTRYYNPQTGRYITSDPVGIRSALNTYAYVRANPFGLVDPTGLYTPPQLEILIGEIAEIAHTPFALLARGSPYIGSFALGFGVGTLLNSGIDYGLSSYYGNPTTLGGALYDLFNSEGSPIIEVSAQGGVSFNYGDVVPLGPSGPQALLVPSVQISGVTNMCSPL